MNTVVVNRCIIMDHGALLRREKSVLIERNSDQTILLECLRRERYSPLCFPLQKSHNPVLFAEFSIDFNIFHIDMEVY